ncbi:MAG: cobalamin B12-binding domain-containing protein, partial [Deltaproteobacteria bacterium]|nr:cobalamin B12-binding domain-containing protein [Deltaproteobacteria bacterium]
MKVLLIEPPSGLDLLDRFFLHEPLGLEYLGGGLLADGHEVELLDMRFEPDVAAACGRFRPDVVGLTGYTVQARLIKELAATVKGLEPGVRVVVGGHHATVRPADFDKPFVDAVVVGEGVGPLRELVEAWAGGRETPSVPGAALPGRMGSFVPRRHPELDSLPLPARSLTARHRANYFCQWMKPLATLRTSLGCVSRCSFCALWSITDGRYLRRTAEAVLSELAGLSEPNVFFCDDEAMCDARRMEHLARMIREAGIRKRYFLQARVDTIARHPEVFARWREIGLEQVFIGMETFSDDRLTELGKGITVEQQAHAVKILHDLGVVAFGSFVVDPASTRQDFRRLASHVSSLGLRYAMFSVLTPLPGTELYAEQEARLTTRDTDLFDLTHAVLPTELPLEEFYAEYARLFRASIPWHRKLPVLAKYGLGGMFRELRWMGPAIGRLGRGH